MVRVLSTNVPRAGIREEQREDVGLSLELTTGYEAAIITRGNMNIKDYHAHMYYLQSAAREILNDHRVCACCRAVIPGRKVEVWANSTKQRARYRNVIRCADVWVCPVCANQITANRRDDLRKVVKAMRPKTIVAMVSLTIRHKRHDGLQDSLSCLLDAWRSMTQCRSWDKVRNSVLGYVRSIEVTFGDANGWHPHIHLLLFVKPEECITVIYTNIRNWWDSAVRSAGGDSDIAIATQMTLDFDGIDDYLSKWGLTEEMTRGGMSKRGRDGGDTPFALLHEYMDEKNAREIGHSPALIGVLFREYARAFRGKRQLTWSRKPNIRDAVGLSEEKTEEEIIAGKEDGYVLLATLSHEEWKAIIYCKMRGELLGFAAEGNIGDMRRLIDDCKKSYIEDTNLCE